MSFRTKWENSFNAYLVGQQWFFLFFLFSISILGVLPNIYSQIQPSVYAGAGMETNLGGAIGNGHIPIGICQPVCPLGHKYQ